MAGERLVRILTLLVDADGSADIRPARLCELAAEVTAVSGAGVMLLAQEHPQASLCTTGDVSATIEDLQYSLDEGPCIDAHRSGTVIAEPDLADPAVRRWPAYSPRALSAGVRAVFGYPIRVGTARIGALNLYRDQPGPLDDNQQADALVMADVAARTILNLQAEAPPGGLPPDLEAATARWDVVHQAAGMVSLQLDVSAAEALARLRAYAFRSDRLVTDVAREVVALRLNLDSGY